MTLERGLKDFGGGFLVLCLVLVLIFGYMILRPFLKIFMMALVLAILSQPMYNWILRRTRGRASVSSFLACTLVVVLIIVPCLGLLALLAQQSLQLYEWVNERISAGLLDKSLFHRMLDLQQRLLPWLDVSQIDIGESIKAHAEKLSAILVSASTGAMKAVTLAIWQFFLMLFALFYFIKDGGAFLRRIMHLTPLPASLIQEIFERFKGVSESAFYGTFLTALAQGFLGGIGFLIVGLPAVVWGVAMAFFSLIPLVGTALVWGPAAVLLILSGRTVAGILLIVWGSLVVGMCDNLLRPFIMKGKSELHPLLIFFALIGGIFAFGLLGILLGPLAIVLVITLLQAYEQAARPVLEDLNKR
jgi:predicted PurR-regulated permease PerM